MFSILGGDGKEYGPVSTAKIQEWIAAGRANLQTKAKRPNETEWRALGEFPEFNPAANLGVMSAPAAEVSPGFVPSVPPPAPTPAAAVARLPLASRWLRLGSYLLDSIIAGCFMLPGFVLLIMAGVFGSTDSGPLTAVGISGFVALFGGLIILLIIQIYLLTTRGQTIAKIVVGIKIVSFDTEENPGFVKAFLLRSLVNALIGSVPALGGIYTIVDACFIFREDQRCIHDLIAGTKVVKA